MAERRQLDLGTVLRQEADRHLPDRDVMLSRIAQRRAAPSHSRWAFTTLRPVAAAVSVVATLVVGFTGIRLLGDRPEPDRAPAATEGSPSPSGSESTPAPSASSRAPREKQKAAVNPKEPRTAPATVPATPSRQPVNKFLSSTAVVDSHSVGTWAQGQLTLTTTEAISALDVAISVVKAEGVQAAGNWSSISADRLTAAVTEEKDRLVYRFTLKQGTLAPGSYVFAVQYQHALGDRESGADNYVALAIAGENEALVTGDFQRK